MAIESITGNNINKLAPSKTSAKAKVESTETATGPATAPDKLSLSATAAPTGSREPEIDEKRVADIKAALQSGTYQVNPDSIAKKILQLDSLLPNSS